MHMNPYFSLITLFVISNYFQPFRWLIFINDFKSSQSEKLDTTEGVIKKLKMQEVLR